MKLDDWLKMNSMTNEAFGDLIGQTGQSVRNYRHDIRTPGRDVMPKIVEATGGAVMPNDFYALPELSPDDLSAPEASHG